MTDRVENSGLGWTNSAESRERWQQGFRGVRVRA